ncbi:PREDICTED: uncharacterized protein LOC108747826 [Trachymyrmex septentrionalis]|uniref:uncharacterized protein LOC108747826 n=1 Tax=Trachymyrmex septentrionalis TaxID=34720 RepID=UPI00084F376E|nr:PREDICTED: uncharacterized protein LOC108747826 [Trachymyrmex septentrionalis]
MQYPHHGYSKVILSYGHPLLELINFCNDKHEESIEGEKSISGLNLTDDIRPMHTVAGVGQTGGCVRRHGCISVPRRGGSRSMPRNRGTPESRAHQQASACSAVPIRLGNTANSRLLEYNTRGVPGHF